MARWEWSGVFCGWGCIWVFFRTWLLGRSFGRICFCRSCGASGCSMRGCFGRGVENSLSVFFTRRCLRTISRRQLIRFGARWGRSPGSKFWEPAWGSMDRFILISRGIHSWRSGRRIGWGIRSRKIFSFLIWRHPWWIFGGGGIFR